MVLFPNFYGTPYVLALLHLVSSAANTKRQCTPSQRPLILFHSKPNTRGVSMHVAGGNLNWKILRSMTHWI
jgi:hypothetical protein